jgi:hypothetical protein
MAAAPDGMLRRRAGRVTIVINQVEDEGGRRDMARRDMALKLASLVRGAWGNSPLGIVFGSARRNRWEEP